MCDEKQINNYVAAGVRLPPCKQIVTSILQLFPPKLLANRNTHELGDPNGTNLIYMMLKGATDLSTSMSVSDSVSGSESNHDLDLGSAASTSVFYPAILQCFAIILVGYFAGKLGVITSKESKGLNTFIGTFSLPALIFLSMAQLNLNQINWKFLLGICLAKTVIFASVITISLIVSKGKKLDQAGLFAIFCTQSNDFALGYPILKSLYGKTYPHSPDYMYLLAPINLILLNPIAFALMEISKQNNVTRQSKGSGQGQQIQEDDQGKLENCFESSINRSSTSASRCAIFKRVMRGFLLNPAVIMTILGMAANFIFKHRIPVTVEGIMKDLGSAFSAASLFSLGLTMVGSAGSLKESGFVVSGILILVKLLVMPLVSREFVSFFQAVEDGNRNETMMLSNFAFLYGTLPTAPGVFVYATQFNMALEMIAGAMVACTFISAPIIFVSAKMIALNLSTEFNLMDYYHSYDLLVFSMSLIGLCASLWVLVLFMLRKTWKTFPHFVNFCLVISQCVTCIGGIIRSGKSIGIGTGVGLAGDYNDNWELFPEFGSAIILFSIFSTKIWTGFLAISLIVVKRKRVIRILKLRPYMGLISWGVPACTVATLVFYLQRQDIEDGQENSFLYYLQEAHAVSILVIFTISFAVTVGCLVMSCGRRTGSYQAQQTTSTLFHDNLALDFNPKEDHHHLHCQSFKGQNQTVCQILSETSTLTAVTPVIPSYLHFYIVPWSTYEDCHRSSKLPGTDESNKRIDDLPDDVTHKSYSSTDFNSDCYQTSSSHCKASSSRFILCDSDILGNKDGGHSISYGVDFCSATKLRSSAHSTQPKETEILSPDDQDDENNKIHTGRHIILLVFLCSSTFVGINISLWTRRKEEISEIDVQLIFLDAILHFGQGICTFLLFGFNMKAVLMGVKKL